MEEVVVVKSKKSGFSRKDEIILQATSMFKEKGYSGASVRDLAQQAGIEAPSIYSHFKSKEDILQRICAQMAELFMKGIAKAENNPTPNDQFLAAIRSHVKIIIKNQDASAVMWNEWKHLKGSALEEFKIKKKLYESRFQKIISQGIKDGQFKMVDSMLISNFVFSALNGVSFWYHGQVKPKVLISHFQELFIDGISKK